MLSGQTPMAPRLVLWFRSVLYFLCWHCLQSSFQVIFAGESKAKAPAAFPLGRRLEEHGASFSSKGPSGRGGRVTSVRPQWAVLAV